MAIDTLHSARFLSLKTNGGWEFCERVNASAVVAIVAVNDAGELLMTEQFRIPLQRPIIELPAGLVGDDGDPDESITKAAARELEEETGYRPAALELLTQGPSSAGMSTEVLHFMMAHEIRKVGSGGGTDSESIIVHQIPLKEVHDWLEHQSERGLMVDPKVYTGLYFLAQRRGNLELR
jgi:ADP-ribose pyrophosphatase